MGDNSARMKEEKSEDSISDDDRLSQFSVSEQSDVVESPEDPIVAAAQLKDEGNAKFKVKKYGEAIDLYTKAYGEIILSIMPVMFVLTRTTTHLQN